MKKMMLVSLVLLLSQFSMALGLAKETIETRMKLYAERIERARLENGGDFTKDAKTMKLVSESLDKIVRGTSADVTNLIKLINNEATGRAVLAEVARLSSIIGDKEAKTPEELKQVAAAKKGLELLALSGKSVDLLVQNDAEAKVQSQKIELAIKISEKIAKFNDFTSEKAKTYAKAYETALENGLSPRDAMKEASAKAKPKKEITEEDLTTCFI